MVATQLLAQLIGGADLTEEQTCDLLTAMMGDELEPTLTAGLLTALAAKGESVDEIVGAAAAMRAHVAPVKVPEGVNAIDTCGTGGDGQPIFNVSTTAAIVTAAAGATVAKHGNRSNARPSGSAEVLDTLGINLEADVANLEHCLARCRVAFLYAIRLHPAMRHAAPIRRALGIRTIFNLVGPLTNPAGVRRQLLGVNRPELVETMLEALRRLGAERAMVVHGREGLCDLSVAGPTLVGYWDGSHTRLEEIDGGVIGAEPTTLEQVRITSPQHSAELIRQVLAGNHGAAREMVVFNASAALWVAGLANDWDVGAQMARAAIDSGAAQATLAEWMRLSHEPA